MDAASKAGAVKGVFDRSKWRQHKYSYKSKVQCFEEQRLKSTTRRYKNRARCTGSPKNLHLEDSQEHGSQKQQRSNRNTFAKQELEKKMKERELKKQQKLKETEDRNAALQKYRREKTRRNKILSKKTKKGQPVMAGRMELLLEKIQKMVS